MVTGYTQVTVHDPGEEKRHRSVPPSSMAKQFYFTL
uniref:Uncharacterized protein n=1 Tax=Anguilla anguilla TaxID=7936 RepID=A0A0E9UXM6_ANGAN